ncbi:hypothetical protein T09_13140 [Trichinella sp. T9]|nr:hypothetical protein T09_13140 [Trichinella sp. T9]
MITVLAVRSIYCLTFMFWHVKHTDHSFSVLDVVFVYGLLHFNSLPSQCLTNPPYISTEKASYLPNGKKRTDEPIW